MLNRYCLMVWLIAARGSSLHSSGVGLKQISNSKPSKKP